MNELIITPGFYKHWKGQIYYVIEVHIRRDTDPFVVYSACYGDNSLHTRPVSEWFDVMGQKENGEPLYRFEKIKHEVAEVRHGKWENWVEKEPDIYGWVSLDTVVCSICNQSHTTKTPYCPNCGAKMDGEKENGK